MDVHFQVTETLRQMFSFMAASLERQDPNFYLARI